MMRTFTRTFAPAFAFIFGLTACQTLSLEADPERTAKQVIAATSLAVDAVHSYGTLPVCASGVGDMCKKPKLYADAKLLSSTFAASLQTLRAGERPSVFLTAGLLYFQYQLAKTVADAPGPTNPEGPPSDSVARQLQALQMIDILVNSADDRIEAASGPNVKIEELLVELQAKVAALP